MDVDALARTTFSLDSDDGVLRLGPAVLRVERGFETPPAAALNPRG